MRNLDEQEKRDLLKEILMDLSKSQDVLKEPKDRAGFFVRLEDIYYKCDKENFRHFYSDIFAVLTLIDGDSDIGSLDILAQNMEAIKDGYIPKNMDENKKLINISKEIIKLYDHTNLEIARINYTKTMAHETLSELAKTKKMVDELENTVRTSQSNIQEMADDIKKENNETKIMQKEMQKEYISILGIFAAIVLSFTGGFAFTSSVLENFHNGNIYRWLVIIFLVGLVLINILYGLFFFIERIVYQKNPQNIKPLIIIDSIIVALMLLIGAGWLFGVVEKVQQKNVNIFYPDNSQIEYSVSQNATNDTVSSN